MTKKRKTISLLLIFIIVISVFVASACSSEKDSITGLSYGDFVSGLDSGKWDIRVAVYIEGDQSSVWVYNQNFDEYTGPSALRVNDEELELGYCCDNCNGYWSFFTFIEGNTYNLSLLNANQTREVNIRVPNQVSGSSTQAFNPANPFTLNWSMERNTDVQGVFVEWNVDETIIKAINIAPNQRTYTILANTVPQDSKQNFIAVDCLNYVVYGEVIFYAITEHIFVEHDPDISNRNNNLNCRDRANRALKLIHNSKL